MLILGLGVFIVHSIHIVGKGKGEGNPTPAEQLDAEDLDFACTVLILFYLCQSISGSSISVSQMGTELGGRQLKLGSILYRKQKCI